MKRTTAFALLAGAFAASGTLPAGGPLSEARAVAAPAKAGKAQKNARSGPAKAAPKMPKVDFQTFTLKNGLKVIISERHDAPVIALNITYNVGSRDEKAGRTGFAHLFEHMMFQGSENVGKAEHFILISNYGGTMNGSTSFDRTNYFEALPANQLDLALFLESDRMRSLDVSKENLDNQRNAVQEERRMRYDNAPYGTMFERLLDLTYDNFAYKHSTIGSMADLNAASVGDVSEFFRLYYAPNNATLTLVGDVQAKDALARIEKYFGNIVSQPAQVVPDEHEPIHTAERRATYDDALAPLPRIAMMYPTVPGNADDAYALDLLSTVLGGGESSRMYQALVKEQQSATSASVGLLGLRGSSPVIVTAMVAPGKTPAEVEKGLDEQIRKIQDAPVTQDELDRAKTTFRASMVSTLELTLSTANTLGELATYFGNPNLINEQGAKYQAVTIADLQRVAKKYLQPTNRGVIVAMPAAKSQTGAPAGTPAAPAK